MKALALNCTLKRSPDESNTAALAQVVLDALSANDVETEMVRVADHVVEPGVVSEPVTDRDEWPSLREKVVAADILIIATPTWLGQPSSIAKRVLERMDALLSETKDDGRPIIAEISGALIDLGYTIPGQGWTYWNKGPGPGEEEYLSSDETEWSNTTGQTAAQNLLAVASALTAHSMPAPAG